MALCGTLVKETLIKSDGDVFLDLFCYKPFCIPHMSPLKIQSVDILDGEWGSVGSLTNWIFSLGGKELLAKEVLEAHDKENKLVRYKVVDGTLMDLYKSFLLTIHVATEGAKHMVTWTLTYEKLNENIEDPTVLMDFCLDVTKDIDTHQSSL